MTRWRNALGSLVHSLKFRLTAVSVVALALGILMITVLVERQAEDDVLRAQREREMEQVVRMASVLSRRVLEFQRTVSLASQVITPQSLVNDSALQQALQTQSVLRGSFSAVFVADLDGDLRALVDDQGERLPGFNIGDREYFRRTLLERRAIVSQPVTSRASGNPVLVLTQPLIQQGRLFGMLGAALALNRRDLIDDLVDGDIDNGSIFVVTDISGRILAHPDATQLMHRLSEDDARFGEAFKDWQLMGSPNEPTGLHLNQRGQLVSVAGVAGQDWLIWHNQPEGELLGPLYSARRHALQWAAVVTVVLAVLLLALFGALLRPLRTLRHKAQHLFDGQASSAIEWPDDGSEIGHLARVLRHVGAERAQFETFNNQVLKKLRSVMHAAPVGIVFTRAHRLELVSDEFCRLLGRTEVDLLGQHARLIHAEAEQYRALHSEIIEAFKAARPYQGEWQLARADGSLFWAELRGRPVDPEDHTAGAIWTVSDITQQVAERTHLTWSASHDVLTGLANRRVFNLHLKRLFDDRRMALPAELIAIDLDHFKPINDLAGHAAGDAMLKAVAAAIVGKVRTSDLVVRTGGDEFSILLTHCSHEVAMRIAEDIRSAITDIHLDWGPHHLQVGASLGVATLSDDTLDAAAWLAAADAACYAAKAQGRDTVRAAERPRLRVVS